MRKRNKQMKFWCSESEFASIEKKIEDSGMTKQDYLLNCALKKKIRRIDGLDDLTGLIGQVKRIGNNINQIAKVANTTGVVDLDALSLAVNALAKIYQKISAIWKEIQSWQ